MVFSRFSPPTSNIRVYASLSKAYPAGNRLPGASSRINVIPSRRSSEALASRPPLPPNAGGWLRPLLSNSRFNSCRALIPLCLPLRRIIWRPLFLPAIVYSSGCCWFSFLQGFADLPCFCIFYRRPFCWRHRPCVFWPSAFYCSGFWFCVCTFFASTPFFFSGRTQ